MLNGRQLDKLQFTIITNNNLKSRMGEGLGSREPISCYSSILKTVETVPGATAIVDPTRSA